MLRRKTAYVGTKTGAQVLWGLPGGYRFCDLELSQLEDKVFWVFAHF